MGDKEGEGEIGNMGAGTPEMELDVRRTTWAFRVLNLGL